MLSKKVEEAINEQIKWELYSGYLYYSMAAYFESISLGGFARWMYAQGMEEVAHAHRFYRYVNERGGRVTLQAIDGPKVSWESPLEVFEEAYKHECLVSQRINNLVDIAREEKDHATENMLQWFVAEQVEEEASADAVVQKLKMVQSAPNAMYMMDREMGLRPLPTAASLVGEED